MNGDAWSRRVCQRRVVSECVTWVFVNCAQFACGLRRSKKEEEEAPARQRKQGSCQRICTCFLLYDHLLNRPSTPVVCSSRGPGATLVHVQTSAKGVLRNARRRQGIADNMWWTLKSKES